jgi:hypothetical protein
MNSLLKSRTGAFFATPESQSFAMMLLGTCPAFANTFDAAQLEQVVRGDAEVAWPRDALMYCFILLAAGPCIMADFGVTDENSCIMHYTSVADLVYRTLSIKCSQTCKRIAYMRAFLYHTNGGLRNSTIRDCAQTLLGKNKAEAEAATCIGFFKFDPVVHEDDLQTVNIESLCLLRNSVLGVDAPSQNVDVKYIVNAPYDVLGASSYGDMFESNADFLPLPCDDKMIVALKPAYYKSQITEFDNVVMCMDVPGFRINSFDGHVLLWYPLLTQMCLSGNADIFRRFIFCLATQVSFEYAVHIHTYIPADIDMDFIYGFLPHALKWFDLCTHSTDLSLYKSVCCVFISLLVYATPITVDLSDPALCAIVKRTIVDQLQAADEGDMAIVENMLNTTVESTGIDGGARGVLFALASIIDTEPTVACKIALGVAQLDAVETHPSKYRHCNAVYTGMQQAMPLSAKHFPERAAASAHATTAPLYGQVVRCLSILERSLKHLEPAAFEMHFEEMKRTFHIDKPRMQMVDFPLMRAINGAGLAFSDKAGVIYQSQLICYGGKIINGVLDGVPDAFIGIDTSLFYLAAYFQSNMSLFKRESIFSI